MLEFLDYPRQSLWNVPASLSKGDVLGALPGLAGLGVGAGLAATGLGLPLAFLGGSLAGGLGQGIGQATGSDRFNAPTGNSLIEALGMDPDSGLGMAAGFGAQIAGDPLMYAGIGGVHKGLEKGVNYLDRRATQAFMNRMRGYPPLSPELERVLASDPNLAWMGKEMGDDLLQSGVLNDASQAAHAGLLERNEALGNEVALQINKPPVGGGTALEPASPLVRPNLQRILESNPDLAEQADLLSQVAPQQEGATTLHPLLGAESVASLGLQRRNEVLGSDVAYQALQPDFQKTKDLEKMLWDVLQAKDPGWEAQAAGLLGELNQTGKYGRPSWFHRGDGPQPAMIKNWRPDSATIYPGANEMGRGGVMDPYGPGAPELPKQLSRLHDSSFDRAHQLLLSHPGMPRADQTVAEFLATHDPDLGHLLAALDPTVLNGQERARAGMPLLEALAMHEGQAPDAFLESLARYKQSQPLFVPPPNRTMGEVLQSLPEVAPARGRGAAEARQARIEQPRQVNELMQAMHLPIQSEHQFLERMTSQGFSWHEVQTMLERSRAQGLVAPSTVGDHLRQMGLTEREVAQEAAGTGSRPFVEDLNPAGLAGGAAAPRGMTELEHLLHRMQIDRDALGRMIHQHQNNAMHPATSRGILDRTGLTWNDIVRIFHYGDG